MNNPFQQLDKKQFPRDRGLATGSVKKSVPAPVETGDTDASLFLQYVNNSTVVKSVHTKHTHPLAEQLEPALSHARQRKIPTVEKKSPSIEVKPSDIPETGDSLFFKAMQEVVPLHGQGRSVSPTPEAKEILIPPQDIMASFMEGKLEFALSNTDEYCEGHVVGLDEMTMNKLRCGALSPEAHLDLHGLNTLQAFEAMRNFFRSSWHKALRTVLIIPGRGQNSPNGVGILRSKVQDWLTQEPLKRVVLAFCTAQQLDGGLGSLYVLLRKYKKKGRIYWERTPNDIEFADMQ